MMISIAILFFFSKAVLGADICESFPYDLCPITIGGIPETGEELNEICPKLMNYVECLGNYDKTCKGEGTQFYIVFTNGEFESYRNLLADICDEGTLLHAAVTESLKCLKDSISNYTCEGKDLVRKAYPSKPNSVQDANLMNYLRKRQCLFDVYDVTCFLEYVSEKCGDLAKDVVIETINRAYFILNVCNLDILLQLAKEVETMEISAEQKDILSESFRRLTWE